MPRKGEPKLRIEYLPVALFFFMLGIGLAACWEWEFWDVTSSIGSLLAGTGTVGLLWFGWTKANEWMRQLQLKKAIDIIVNELQQLLESSSQLSRIYHQALHTQKVIKITESNNIELAKVELEDIEEKASDQFGKALASIDLLVSCCLTLDNSELLLPRLEQLRAELGSVSDIHYLSGLEHTLFSF
ncbi:hypothetical protein MAQ5080_02160 [Marinomonas aquimarina]|uniref:Uncharacterized protein n=2 Tax=Marinomonas aquimarina TaxID=295068 RepID=A0A1A8TIU0_9GAMM|nr:hypothetical protein MAQ5080_02160 [Marinomonas aquimarina]